MSRKKKLLILVTVAVFITATVIVLLYANSNRQDFSAQSVDFSSDGSAVTLTITCKSISNKKDNPNIPSTGVIYSENEVLLSENDTVYGILSRIALDNEIAVTADETGYVTAVNGIKALSYGEASGWICTINGEIIWEPSAQYKPKAGDVIEWKYITELPV